MSELDEQKKIAIALRRLEKSDLDKAFDAFHLKSRPNKKQILVLKDIGRIQYRYVVAGNQSGKSQLAARDLAWFLNDNHPYYTRPEEWASEPMTVLIGVQDLTLGQEMWTKKVRPFLHGDWKEERQGNSLKRCVERNTGDVIYFLSHSDGSEKNRKHMQGYVAHYLWLDEMPSSHKILEELQRRVDARKGRFLATFTPKFKNDTIRRVVDASKAPLSKKYQMSKLDNPIYADRLDEELQKLAGYPESEKRTILYGEWSTGDGAVYSFDYDFMTVTQLPESYGRGWRHVEAVDPALRSKCGYTLWAEDPSTGVWYLVEDKYIEGTQTLDPNELLNIITKRSQGYNVVRRISDSMAWFTSVANTKGITYLIPYDKNSRKEDLIKGLQSALSLGKIKVGRWCTAFIDEIQSCQMSETTDRIINSSSFHTLDCAQYFCDLVPKYEKLNLAQPWAAKLREENEQYKAKQAVAASAATSRVRPIRSWGRGRFNVR